MKYLNKDFVEACRWLSNGELDHAKMLVCFRETVGSTIPIAAVGAEMTKFYYGLITKMSGTAEMTPALVINLVFMLLSNAMAAMAMMQSGGLSSEIIGV